MEIEELIQQIKKSKEEANVSFDNIKYNGNRQTTKITEKDLLKAVHIKDKEEVYAEMKKRFRAAWKSPGYPQGEFNKLDVLRGNRLNEWEIARVHLVERSYKKPEGAPGMIFTSRYEEFKFPEPVPKYKDTLENFTKQFDDYVQRPSKYGKVKEDLLLEKILINNKEPFHLNNTVQTSSFGFDSHQTWESELTRRVQAMKKTRYANNKSDKINVDE